jgi:hypothetical protein
VLEIGTVNDHFVSTIFLLPLPLDDVMGPSPTTRIIITTAGRL